MKPSFNLLIFSFALLSLLGCHSNSSDSGAGAAGISGPLQGVLDPSYNSVGFSSSLSLPFTADLVTGLLVANDDSSVLLARSGGSLEGGAFDGSGNSIAMPWSLDCNTVFGTTCTIGASMVQTDGKIVIGFMVATSPVRIKFIRLNADGSADFSFGSFGVASVDSRVGHAEPFRIIELSDGRLLALAEMVNSNPQSFSPAVIRMTANGFVDPTFGASGVSLLSLEWNSYSMAINPVTNDIYLGGKDSSIPGHDLVEHLSPSGVEDLTFGTSGLATVGTNAPVKNDIAYDVVNNKILVMANGTGNSTDVRVVRLLPNGHFDLTFGVSGVVQMTISSGIYTYQSVQLLLEPSTGNIIVLGNESEALPSLAPASGFVLLRLTGDGSVDTTFATNGYLTGPAGIYFAASKMQFTVDNKLLLGGISSSYTPMCTVPIFPCPPAMSYNLLNSQSALVVRVE